jgi:four helix bundle protein
MNAPLEKPYNIQERTFLFAKKSLKIYLFFKKAGIPDALCVQFIKSATSVGANCREAKHAETKKDFAHKLAIAKKEIGECLYWVALLKEYSSNEQVEALEKEGGEILKILSKIILNTRV